MKGLYDQLVRGYTIAASAVALALLVVIFAGIVSRQLQHSLVWSNEVAVTLFLWLIFLGAGVASAENAHIRVMLAVNSVPANARRVLLIVVTYVGAALLVALLANSVLVTYGFRDNRFTTIDVSSAWSWSAVPVGLVMVLAGWVRHGRWTWRMAGEKSEEPTEIVI
jgi:TRAP-type C4-dicarboxylate transport system permease small subunit